MLTLFLQILTLAAHAFCEAPRPPTEDVLAADAQGSYFSSKANFVNGESRALPNSGSYSNFLGDIQLIKDWQKQWRFYGGAQVAQAESNDGSFTRTRTSLNHLQTGGQYWLRFSGFQIVPDGRLIYPLLRNDVQNDDVLTGEGAIEARIGAWAFALIPALPAAQAFAFLGGEYRDGGRSHLLPYQVGARYQFNNGIWFSGEYRGSTSLTDDADTNNRAVRDAHLTRVDAGSFQYNSVNPSYSEGAFEGGMRLDALELRAGVALRLNGNNSAEGWTATAGVRYSFGVETDEDDFTPAKNKRARKKKPTGFAPLKDDYDESLFSEDPTRPPPAPTEVHEVQPADPVNTEPSEVVPSNKMPQPEVQMLKVPPKSKPKPAAKKKPRPNKKLNKMLNDAEKALEEL